MTEGSDDVDWYGVLIEIQSLYDSVRALEIDPSVGVEYLNKFKDATNEMKSSWNGPKGFVAKPANSRLDFRNDAKGKARELINFVDHMVENHCSKIDGIIDGFNTDISPLCPGIIAELEIKIKYIYSFELQL